MRALGIDVGIATTGWAILDKDDLTGRLKLVDYGTIITKPENTTSERLKFIFEDLNSLIDKFGPEVMAIESVFYFKNQKTVINVSQARGVMLLVANLKELPTFDYTPLQVKTSVSAYGRASKKQVQETVKMILNMEEIPKPDDAADAIAVAICHCNTANY